MLAPTAPSLHRRGLALGLSLALAAPAGVVMAPVTAHAAAMAPAEDAALAESRALYDEGKARFDTFDYEGAVDLWTKAYAKLPEDNAGVRNAMVYNIATAQEKAYDVDKDLQHLRQAVLLLQSYIKNYKAIYKRTPETEAEVQKAENRIAALQERIARAERGEAEAPPAVADPGTPGEEGTATDAIPDDARYGSGAVDGIQWNTGHNPPPDQELVTKNRLLAQEEEKTDHMLIGSYVLLSVGGVAALAGAGAVLGGRALRDPTDETAGRGARLGGYGMLGFGVASLIAGTALLVIGLDRRKKARQGSLVAGAPMLGPGLAGASLRVRF
ncbi:MAG: hypothetical protein H6712_32795 [Myxococcales bacterium]|nr:hypothetical protein [Myxococcales bacterium]MCB9718672.1 hypothetical protein [Myxococcales bacterium]